MENALETDFLDLYEQAENGSPEAQYQLGLCFLNGIGIRRDARLAEVWLLKSASANHLGAIRDLQWIHEAALLDIERVSQWLAAPVKQPEPVVTEPVTEPVQKPEPVLAPLPAYLQVPDYTPFPRIDYQPRPMQPGGTACGTQYLIEGHPAVPEGQPIGYVPEATYTEPVPPYVPSVGMENAGGIPAGTEYLLSASAVEDEIEDTIIDHEKPGVLDRLIIGFRNQRFHKVCSILGGLIVFVLVVGIGHCIGRFDRLIGANSEMKNVTKVIHIHQTKNRQVGVGSEDINSMVKDLMDSSYGRFDVKLGCWSSRSGGTEFCFKVNRVDAVKTKEGDRVYVLATGRMASDSNIADGIIGMFVLEPQFGSNYTTVAKNPFVTAGSGDEPPENWQFVRLGRDDVWGWQGEIENNSLGETDSGIILFTQIEGNIKNIGYIPTSFEMLDLGNVNGHIANARQAIDLKGTIKIEEYGNGMYPIRLTVDGMRNGSQKQGESIQITFRKDVGEYVVPMRNPFTY